MSDTNKPAEESLAEKLKRLGFKPHVRADGCTCGGAFDFLGEHFRLCPVYQRILADAHNEREDTT